MIPEQITDYLKTHGAPFARHQHSRAFTAQEVAAALHVPGSHFAKTVLVTVDGDQPVIALVPAHTRLDELRLARALGVGQVRLMTEDAFVPLFPHCEPGAEPPFGGLYGLRVVADESLGEGNGRIAFRGGSHEESLEMRFEDLVALERPIVTSIAEVETGLPHRHPGHVPAPGMS